jgi:hypothetical protein
VFNGSRGVAARSPLSIPNETKAFAAWSERAGFVPISCGQGAGQVIGRDAHFLALAVIVHDLDIVSVAILPGKPFGIRSSQIAAVNGENEGNYLGR